MFAWQAEAFREDPVECRRWQNPAGTDADGSGDQAPGEQRSHENRMQPEDRGDLGRGVCRPLYLGEFVCGEFAARLGRLARGGCCLHDP